MEFLGNSRDDKSVYIDHDHTNVTYHLLETPDLLDLVREVLPTIKLDDGTQVVVERDMGRIVGTTNLVETTETDEIVYAKRIGRLTYSRFVKGRSPMPCRHIVVVFRKQKKEYVLWTAMCGRLLPDDAYEQDSVFRATHAMTYDESLVQLDTVATRKPVDY